MTFLDIAVSEMNPQPWQVKTEADEHAWMGETFRRVTGGWHVIEDVAAGRQLDSNAQRALDLHIERLKPAAERVYEDMRMKLATAPAPPPPEQDYGARLKVWLLSPGYQLVGGPCVSGLITQAATGEAEGVVLFGIGAVLFLLVPPALRQGVTVPRTLTSVGFIVMASVAVVVSLLVSGLGLALLAFALLVGAFLLGQRTPVKP